MSFELIKAENYATAMDSVVLPYIKERLHEGYYEPSKGHVLNYEKITFHTTEEIKKDSSLFFAPRGTVVIVHGFTEGIHKFYETAYYYLQLGYNVFLFQQLGHGSSTHLVEDKSLVHIPDAQGLIDDLHGFVSTIVKASERPEAPLLVHAHSMGGGVTACLLEKYPGDFKKAILSSPMLSFNMSMPMILFSTAFAKVKIAQGKGTDYLPGSNPFNSEPDFENSCTNCKERYDHHFKEILEREDYQMAASSVATSLSFKNLTEYATGDKNMKKVKADVLLFKALQDNMVGAEGQDRFIKGIAPHGKMVSLDGKHELYREKDDILNLYWKEILEFLEIKE